MIDTQYHQLVRRAAWAASGVALFLLCAKLVVWWQTQSVSLLASLVDSLLDMTASLINLWVVRYSTQPADHEHRFGHGKAESLAALAQAMFISGSAVFLILSGVERWFRPQQLQSPEYGIWVSVLAIVITFVLVLYQRHVVKVTNSQAIAADSLHYKADLIMNAAIVVAMTLSFYGIEQADALFALVIGVYILVTSVRIAHQAVQTLLDRSLPLDEIEQIRAAALSVPEVMGIHQVRTRLSGPTRFIQLHIELKDTLPLVEAHSIGDVVEERVAALFDDTDVLIHLDPYTVVLSQEQHEIEQGW